MTKGDLSPEDLARLETQHDWSGGPWAHPPRKAKAPRIVGIWLVLIAWIAVAAFAAVVLGG